jgi:DNA-binding transcriptional regulator YdaS (Cro superfamily)
MEQTPIARWIASNELTMKVAAEQLGATRGTVCKLASKIEAVTGITREKLRPDVYAQPTRAA